MTVESTPANLPVSAAKAKTLATPAAMVEVRTLQYRYGDLGLVEVYDLKNDVSITREYQTLLMIIGTLVFGMVGIMGLMNVSSDWNDLTYPVAQLLLSIGSVVVGGGLFYGAMLMLGRMEAAVIRVPASARDAYLRIAAVAEEEEAPLELKTMVEAAWETLHDIDKRCRAGDRDGVESQAAMESLYKAAAQADTWHVLKQANKKIEIEPRVLDQFDLSAQLELMAIEDD